MPYLVNLIRKNVFNTVFTTNFDDLLNESCYLFSSDVRPLVSAHDSSISTLRITSARPKIIKLHGNFLFDNIKNTIRELESLEDNMRRKFKQYATEYGMIVIGYGGNDRSIMDTLNVLLRSEHNFPHGIYWCIQRNSAISDYVTKLDRYPNFHIVNISGFDEIFADLHDSLDFDLQPEMSDPYGALTNRLNSLIENVSLPEPDKTHPVIWKHITELGKKVSLMVITSSEKPSTLKLVKEKPDSSDTIPFQLLAEVAFRDHNYKLATEHIKSQLRMKKTVKSIHLAFDILENRWDDDLGNITMDIIRKTDLLFIRDPGRTFNWTLNLINAEKYDFAMEVLEIGITLIKSAENQPEYLYTYYLINKGQIKAHQGKKLSNKEISLLKKEIEKNPDDTTLMGIYIVLGKFEEAEKVLQNIQLRELDRIIDWPIFKLLPNKTQENLLVLLEEEFDDG